MESAEYLLSAHREECETCLKYWANETTKHPLSIAHILGSSYVWARRQTGLTLEELSTGEDPLYRDASSEIIALIEDENVSGLVAAMKTAPAPVLVEILDDALAGMGIARTAEWTTSPEQTPPPWVTAMERERARPVPDEVPAVVDALAAATPAPAGADHEQAPTPAPTVWTRTTTAIRHARDRVAQTLVSWCSQLSRLSLVLIRRFSRSGRDELPDEDLGLVHTGPPPEEGQAHEGAPAEPGPGPGPWSLGQVRRLVEGDTALAAEWTAAPTIKGRVRALLWEHAGDTTAVRATWRDHYGQAPPPDLYRYARTWIQEVLAALAQYTPDPLAEASRLVPRRTAAMQRAVDEWAASRAAVAPLRLAQ